MRCKYCFTGELFYVSYSCGKEEIEYTFRCNFCNHKTNKTYTHQELIEKEE